MFIIAKFKKSWIILPKTFRIFLKYIVVGASNTFVDFFIYWTLTRFVVFFGEHYLTTNAISFVVSTTWGFVWNKNWSFRNRDKRKLRQYGKYVAVTLGGLLLAEFSLFGLVNIGLNDITAKLLIVVICGVWSFTMNKLWTFREEF